VDVANEIKNQNYVRQEKHNFIMNLLIIKLYNFEHYNPHKVRIVFKGNVIAKQLPEGEYDKSIKTHA
jgi:NADPH-dependent ferric siderophore reductase